MINEITLRVYGIVIDPIKGVLVSDEYIRGSFFTKFPGGGLEMGEGTRDCLKREFMEETGVEVEIGEHIYTTDYFQPSAFREGQQFIGIYYKVIVKDSSAFKVANNPFAFQPSDIQDPNGEAESLRWIPLTALSENSVQLPTDKIIVKKILEETLNLS
ncbi:NUDIX hydrolase [Rhizosphaericola mali]|uniref:NUDIX domain-containing protein n=1 Tax=Rhizosphaericola mali TaxID=2545455 RepID=A0A5P2FZQ2_9BACT|nr:NUDIX domain-containing protein [Rhizosphaericola mali]QES87888.1 NUDIX domain-containing protein [Rhizosphaericola mali]